MNKTEIVFVTDNLKLAAALTAAGFKIRHGEQIIISGRQTVICEFEQWHNGIEADWLKSCFENKIDLCSQVNEIIQSRSITQQEYVILAFDAARASLHNRSTILHCISKNKPLIHKDIGDGRSLIYREGTSKETLKQLLNNA